MFGQYVIQSCSKQGKQITNGQKCSKDVIERITFYAIIVAFFL